MQVLRWGAGALQSGGRIFDALRMSLRSPAEDGDTADNVHDKEGVEDVDAVFADCRRYCKLCVDTSNCVQNSVFVLLWMLREAGHLQSARATHTAAAKTLRQLATVWNLSEHYNRKGERAPSAPPSHHYSMSFFYGDNASSSSDGCGATAAGAAAANPAASLVAASKRKRARIAPPDFKVPLQRRFQQRKEVLPAYRLLAEAPPEARELGWFAPAYRCEVSLAGGSTFASDFCRTKKKAEQQAAAVALQVLEPTHPTLQLCRHARRRSQPWSRQKQISRRRTD